MKKILRTTLALSVALALTACNNGGVNSVPTPVKTQIAGTIVKGALVNGVVKIYKASDTGFTSPLTTIPAEVRTDDKGKYNAEVVDATGQGVTGALVVRIETDALSQMVCDAATTCADGTARGALIPASQLGNMVLTTVTEGKVDANGQGVSINADVNTLTTLATDAVLSQAAANSNIDLNDATQLATAQSNASTIVGQMLNVDLTTTNIFDLKIPDATNTAEVATAVSETGNTASVLSSLNASFANLTSAQNANVTIAESISDYVAKTKLVSTAVTKILSEKTPGVDVDITAGIAADAAAQAALDALSPYLTELSDQADLIQAEIKTEITNDETIDSTIKQAVEAVIEVVTIPKQPTEINLDLEGDKVVVTTGATGISGGN